jgi:hypothetical protein
MGVNFYDSIETNPKATLMRMGWNLKQTYQPYRRVHEKIAEYILPARGQFIADDTNKGPILNSRILDSTATQSIRTLKSGMLSGITSPSRRWFSLSTGDRDLDEQQDVKEWLDIVKRAMHDGLLKSSFYAHVQTFYGDLGAFGLGAIYIEENFEKIATFMSLPIGSYYIGVDPENNVNKFYREFALTVAQIVEKFGYDQTKSKIDWTNISDAVKVLYENREFEALIYIGHVIMPNDKYVPGSPISKQKKYKSYYFEMGGVNARNQNPGFTSVGDNKLLSENGYDYFPVLAARWEIRGQDVYDIAAPGFVCIGDCMQLQRGESKTLKAIDKTIDPPMVGPPSLKNQRSSILPDDITYLEETQLAQFRPAHLVNFNIRDMESKQDQVRDRIRRAFYEDLFLMMANSDRKQITAREIEERHEEKLLALGPVLENLNSVFDQLIDIFFMFMINQGLLPEPPEALDGMDLKVEYISIMAQAQKSVGIGQIERVTSYFMNTGQMFPNILKKFNELEAADEYAAIVGISPQIIRTDEEVDEMIQAEAQAMQQQQDMANAQMAANTAKELSQADTREGTALNDLMSGVEEVE